MKNILLLLALSLPLSLRAQFVVGAQGMTLKSGAVFTIDSLVFQPSADITLTSNSVQRTSTAVTGVSGNKSIDRVYAFASPITFTGTAGFYYKDAELTGNTESGLRIAYTSTNPATTWVTTTGSVVNASENFISQTFSNATLGRITATSSTAPLPVTIVDFTAAKNDAGHSVLLSWNVAHELNIDRYEVERSGDAKSFNKLGSIKATGHNQYGFTDSKPLNGINYYRLQIIEQDGSFNYSAVRQVSFGRMSDGIKVYPNPVIAQVTINTSDPALEGADGTVTDEIGRAHV